MNSPAKAAADTNELPEYAEELAAFHRAFRAELKSAVDALPLSPAMRVLDAGCGSGFYTGLLADRLDVHGEVVGLDTNAAYLKIARVAVCRPRCKATFQLGELAALQDQLGHYDLVWCAQSLYSLPEPIAALRQMADLLKPGGVVAVLENDTLHEVMLPWPGRLEIAVRAVEYAALADQSRRPSKFYVGRRLPALFAAAGLEPVGFRTQCIDRQAPLSGDLELFLKLYLKRLADRVTPYLNQTILEEFGELIDPASDKYLLRERHFTTSWLNVLAFGRGGDS